MKLRKLVQRLSDIYIGVLLFYLTVKVENVALGWFLYGLCNIYMYFNVEYVYLDLRGAYYYKKDVDISINCAERLVKNRILSMIVNTIITIVDVIVTIIIFM